MKARHIILLLLLTVAASCSKTEQGVETSFTAVVIDPTTGSIEQPATVHLIEREVPTTPFSAVSETVIETFEVPFGEHFSHAFHARRGNRYEYLLRFGRHGKPYDFSMITDGFYYEMKDEVMLTRKASNDCTLEVVPICRVKSYVVNQSPASELDSVWIEFTDGNIANRIGYRGAQSSRRSTSTMAHGVYDLTKKIYYNGELVSTETDEIELAHGRDTTIVFAF